MQPKQVNGGCEVTCCSELAASQEGAWMEGGTDGWMDGRSERVPWPWQQPPVCGEDEEMSSGGCF